MCTVRPETWQKWHGPAAGSTMFLSANEQVSVENLLHGIVTLSGNDASVVLAECIAGTEQAFAEQMNALAKKIGLTNSHFGNSNGWPDEGVTYVTARDLATLARSEIENHYALYKKFYSQPSFTWGKTMGSGDRTSPSRTATRSSARSPARTALRPATPTRPATASPARPTRTAVG